MISIHAPRGGSDRWGSLPSGAEFYFNPRSPWGERRLLVQFRFYDFDFNPRSPWGERLSGVYAPKRVSISFQSTLPVGGAT